MEWGGMKKGTRFYQITVEVEVALAPNAITQPTPESVAAGVRQWFKVHLPVVPTKGGYTFRTAAIRVEAHEKIAQQEAAPSE